MHKLAHIGGKSARSISEQGTSGYERTSSYQDWLELVGMMAAMVAPICIIGFIIHFAFGLFDPSVSLLSAVKWFIPLSISVVVATLLGQRHLLDDFCMKR